MSKTKRPKRKPRVLLTHICGKRLKHTIPARMYLPSKPQFCPYCTNEEVTELYIFDDDNLRSYGKVRFAFGWACVDCVTIMEGEPSP